MSQMSLLWTINWMMMIFYWSVWCGVGIKNPSLFLWSLKFLHYAYVEELSGYLDVLTNLDLRETAHNGDLILRNQGCRDGM